MKKITHLTHRLVHFERWHIGMPLIDRVADTRKEWLWSGFILLFFIYCKASDCL